MAAIIAPELLDLPKNLIQLCETHQDRTFSVGRRLGRIADAADTQERVPQWNLTTHTLTPRHPLAAWLWLNDLLFRVSPIPLRQRIILEAITEWQERCANLDFPRLLNRKKALEGFGSMKPEKEQARAAMIAMERYSKENPLLWILYNDETKTIEFLDDKAFPRESGYKNIWILREPAWDRLWDASSWTSGHLISWLQEQEEQGFSVAWPMPPKTTTVKSMTADYTAMGFSTAGLTKEELRKKLGRAIAIRALGPLGPL